MKKELKRLELKKLFKEFGFLKIDEEYKNAIQSQYVPEFNAAVQQAFKDYPDLDLLYNAGTAHSKPSSATEIKQIANLEINPSVYTQDKQETFNNEHQEQVHINESIPEQENNNKTEIKKLYRKIATKTHPDKVSVKHLNDLYMKAQSAYESDDIFAYVQKFRT